MALLLDEKSPSEIASIPAATKIASVPVPSSGAWKLITPNLSFSAISVSPVWSVNIIGLSSAVAVCFKLSPASCECVKVISLLAPKLMLELSANNDNIFESKIRVASPFKASVSENVAILLSAPLAAVTPPPLAASHTAFDPSHLRNWPLEGESWPIFVTLPSTSDTKLERSIVTAVSSSVVTAAAPTTSDPPPVPAMTVPSLDPILSFIVELPAASSKLYCDEGVTISSIPSKANVIWLFKDRPINTANNLIYLLLILLISSHLDMKFSI